MRLSDNTLAILKNFSAINPSILFKPGNDLKTISPQKTVMAQAAIEEEIESRAAIFDLSRFLSTLSLFKDPDIEFGDKKFTIKSGRSKVGYTYASEDMIIAAPEKNIVLPTIEAEADVEWKNLQNVIRAAGVLQVPDVQFIVRDGTFLMIATDDKDPTSDEFVVEVMDGLDASIDVELSVKVENVKLIPQDYTVSLCKAGMVHFKSPVVQYWVAVQSK